jgi:Putative prokaryotic signal transducing protein
MTSIDWERERKQLRERYASMEEGELEKIARESDGLTEVASEELRSEMARRGIEWPEQFKPELPPVMVARYRDLPDAQVAKSLLDSAGIDSFLADENVVRIDWLWSNLIGGAKLFVREKDAETAKKLLEQSTLETFDVAGVGEYQQPRCPKCNSLDVSLDALDRRIAHPGLLIGLPIPVTHKGWKCNSCGSEWNSPKQNDA